MADNKDIREREKIVREIQKTAESIGRAVKNIASWRSARLKKISRPRVILNQLSSRCKRLLTTLACAIRDEPRDDDDVKTLSVQKHEEDVKSSKTKRSNTSLDRKSKRLNVPRLDASPITSTPSATTVQPTMPESLANEDVFKTTGDSLAESVQNQLQTPEG